MIAAENAQTVTILGATGSIGRSAIDVITSSTKSYKIKTLTANSNAELLAKQAIALRAEKVVIADKSQYEKLKSLLFSYKIEVLAGSDAVSDVAGEKSDIVIAAIVGSAGLLPTLAAVKAGNKIALANKESLVCAGDLIIAEAKKSGAVIIPTDSEHNAIFQVFDFGRPENISKITLTASGGPFRNFTKEQMLVVTPKQAIAHPNWSMGSKISVDSATMVNKGLEIIEAYHLFPIKAEQIDVIVHPESVIHSMVEYVDGSVLAQMGTPDMRVPISYALSWPDRVFNNATKLNLSEVGRLTFEKVNNENFPAVFIAKNVLDTGGLMPLVFNSANEVAVEKFLKNEIGFLDIISVIEACLEQFDDVKYSNIEDIISAIDLATDKANFVVEGLKSKHKFSYGK